jgi:BTB/POZ domain
MPSFRNFVDPSGGLGRFASESRALGIQVADIDLRLLSHGSFNDFAIKCQGNTWKVHRAVLSGRCPYFESALSSIFLVGILEVTILTLLAARRGARGSRSIF